MKPTIMRRSPSESSQPARLVWDKDLLLPELLKVGWARYPKASAVLPAHTHKSAFEICYIVRGSVEWWVSNEIYEVGPAQIFVTRPDERHGGRDAMMHPNELYWAQVVLPSAGAISGMTATSTRALRRDYAGMTLHAFPGSESVKDAFSRLVAAHRDRAGDKYAAVGARAAFLQLLVSVVSDHERQVQSLRNKLAAQSDCVRRAVAWMERHLVQDYRIERLAEVSGLSTSHFHKRFVREVGFSPAAYRTRLRIRQAAMLLRAQDRSVTEIAMSLGFSSSQFFATIFKTLTGLPPKSYQARYRNRSLMLDDSNGIKLGSMPS